MLPNDLVLDEVVTPKSFDELIERSETSHRVEHEQTTLESISSQAGWNRADAFRRTASDAGFFGGFFGGNWDASGLLLRNHAGLFCSNFKQRQAETTSPDHD